MRLLFVLIGALLAFDAGSLRARRAELLEIADGLEGLPGEADYAAARQTLLPELPEEARPYFVERPRALNAVYRTVAVLDYTAALDGTIRDGGINDTPRYNK